MPTVSMNSCGPGPRLSLWLDNFWLLLVRSFWDITAPDGKHMLQNVVIQKMSHMIMLNVPMCGQSCQWFSADAALDKSARHLFTCLRTQCAYRFWKVMEIYWIKPRSWKAMENIPDLLFWPIVLCFGLHMHYVLEKFCKINLVLCLFAVVVWSMSSLHTKGDQWAYVYDSLTCSISIPLNGTGKTWIMDINGHGKSWKKHTWKGPRKSWKPLFTLYTVYVIWYIVEVCN